MGICKVLTICVALVAVVIGIIGKVSPEAFLKIPDIGFLPFMLVGGNNGILPPYFDITPWQGDNPKEWVRDGDVVVASAPKAGTTWLCYCMDVLRRKGSDDVGLPYKDIMYTTPWLELPQIPGQTWAYRKEKYNTTVLPDGTKLKDYWDNAAFKYRVFKSHFFPRGPEPTAVLPVREMPNVKFVISVRNPLEVAKSIHNFFPKHEPHFRKMWGGFPPLFPNAEAAMKEMLPKGQLASFFFDYVKAWWPYVKAPNVLALHYSDMVKDVSGMVDKLAKFADVSLTSAEKSKVTEKCSFKHMKAHADMFDYRLPLNNGMSVMQSGAHINKGKSGNAEEGISEDMIKQFNTFIESELVDPKLKKWALEGGGL